MALNEERIAALEQRCSPSAVEHLREIRSQPKFSDLVDRLERISGTVCRMDVEQHFLQIISDYDKRVKSVEARCSGFALELLRDLKVHSKFANLISELEKLDGHIYRVEVEAIFFRLTTHALHGREPESQSPSNRRDHS